MSNIEALRYVAAAGLTGVLIWAAVSDALWRRIPNYCALAVIGLYVIWAAATGGAGVVGAVVIAAFLLLFGFALFAFRIWGGGDAKLLASVALFAGAPYLTTFVLVTALAGGAMAVVSLASRPRRALALWNTRGRGDFGRGVPYGVAIAVGGIVAVWGQLLGWIQPYLTF
jgi:prepilin peptidase CpaA